MKPTLKLSVLHQRQSACSGCEFALKHREIDSWPDRKMWCGKLFNGNERQRQQPAYLPFVIESGRVCPVEKFPAAGPEDFASPHDIAAIAQGLNQNALFHALWDEIHNPAREWTPKWWTSVIMRLPSGRCDCKRHAKAYADANPIPFGDDAACWNWGIEFHNSVNVRLGRPVLTVEEARPTSP